MLAQVARALVGNISEHRMLGIGPKPMTYEQKQIVSVRWKRMACSNDPIFTMLDNDITPNATIRNGVVNNRRALHKYRDVLA